MSLTSSAKKLSPQEKILQVLKIIDEQIQISPSGELLRIHESKFGLLDQDELIAILKRLEKDEGIIKLHDKPNKVSQQHWVLEILPPFTSFYKNKQDEIVESELSNLSEEATSKIWPVMNAIKLQLELLKDNKFKLPHDKFRRNRVDYGDLEPILIRFHNEGVFIVTQESWSKRTLPDQPIGAVIIDITDKPDIIHDERTLIEVNEERFWPIYHNLEKRVGKFSMSLESSNQILSVLREIKRLSELTPEGDPVIYQLQAPPGDLLVEEKTILRKLESQGIIKRIRAVDTITSAHTIEVDLNLLNQAINSIEEPNKPEAKSETINWPNDWGWSEDGKTYKAGSKEISFANTESDTYKVFRILVDSKGVPIKTKEIESKTGAKNVQVTISNLNNGKLAKSPIKIVPLKGAISSYKASIRNT